MLLVHKPLVIDAGATRQTIGGAHYANTDKGLLANLVEFGFNPDKEVTDPAEFALLKERIVAYLAATLVKSENRSAGISRVRQCKNQEDALSEATLCLCSSAGGKIGGK